LTCAGKPWARADVQPSEIWADDVAAVIKAKGLKRPVIVGWSFGGFVAADYIRKYGITDIAGLNLVGSIAGLVQQPPPVGNMSPEEMKRRAVMQTSGNLSDYVSVVEATVKIFEFPGMTPAYRDEMRTLGLMVPPYFRKAFAGSNLDHQDVTPKLNLPVLITMGSNDVAQSPDAYARLKAALPKAQYSVFDGMGHLPFAQDPARFNRELAAFVTAASK
jgi:non-heme chloroperoxidase